MCVLTGQLPLVMYILMYIMYIHIVSLVRGRYFAHYLTTYIHTYVGLVNYMYSIYMYFVGGMSMYPHACMHVWKECNLQSLPKPMLIGNIRRE